MKKKIQTQFCFKVDEPSAEMIKRLREDHAISLSRAFKLFLKELLNKLESIE